VAFRVIGSTSRTGTSSTVPSPERLRHRDGDRFGFPRDRVRLQLDQDAGGEAGLAKIGRPLEEKVIEVEGLDQDGVAWCNGGVTNEAAGDSHGPPPACQPEYEQDENHDTDS
jgi:hypothetical protein